MKTLIKIIPLTTFQKNRYKVFLERKQELIANIKGVSTTTLVLNYNKNYSDNYPRINNFQLNSIPDIINGVYLDYCDKENILLGEPEKIRNYLKTLETFKLDENDNLQYLNLKNNPPIIRSISQEDSITYERHTTPKIFLIEEQHLQVQVIPPTEQQKTQYTEHWESIMYQQAFNLELVQHPALTLEQLNSIPDFIDGNKLNDLNKTNLIFSQFVPFHDKMEESISDTKSYTISIHGQLIKSFEYKDERIRFSNPYKKDISFVKKKDCIYLNRGFSQDNSTITLINEPKPMYGEANEKKQLKSYKYTIEYNGEYIGKDFYTKEEAKKHLKELNNKRLFGYSINEILGYTKAKRDQIIYSKGTQQNLIIKTINTMSTNVDFEKAKNLDVVGFERPLKINDPIAIDHEGKKLLGKVTGFQENSDITLLISNSRDIKELTVGKDTKIEPMFILNKEEKMVYLKFSYEEAKAALYNKEPGIQDTINFQTNKNEKDPIFNLMLGNKTDVIPFEKMIDNTMAPVEGRLELRRKAGTGEAYLHGNIKHKELNLDLPIYGLQLNEEQKEALTNQKDIGLVQGFKTNTGTEFNLWVSLDEKLNKVVTAPERSININMIFGVKTSDEQRDEIKSGKGAIIEIKGKEYLFQASAATTKADGLKSNSIEKKIEKTESQSKEIEKEEKKSKGKALKM